MDKLGNKIKNWVIPLSCILLQYSFIVGNVGLILLFLIIFFSFLKTKKIIIHKHFFKVILLLGLLQLILVLSGDYNFLMFIKNFINMILIFLVISNISEISNQAEVYKNYCTIGLISSLIVFIQFILMNFFGKTVGAINIIPLVDSSYWYTTYNRPSAFFTEPQTFCTYMIPLLLLLMEKKEIKKSLFISLACCLTTSSIGIAMVAVIWIRQLFSSSIKKTYKIMFVIVSSVALVLFFTLDQFEFTREKVFSIYNSFSEYSNITSNHFETSTSYSNYLRILKGLDTFIEIPLKEKMLGVGNYNLKTYATENRLVFSWMKIWGYNSTNIEYMSSFFGIIIYYGLIGALYYYIFVYSLFKQSNSYQKKMLFFLIIQSLFTQFFFNGVFTFYFLMIFVFGNYEKKKFLALNVGE